MKALYELELMHSCESCWPNPAKVGAYSPNIRLNIEGATEWEPRFHISLMSLAYAITRRPSVPNGFFCSKLEMNLNLLSRKNFVSSNVLLRHYKDEFM